MGRAAAGMHREGAHACIRTHAAQARALRKPAAPCTLHTQVKTTSDYDQYCHYVAGLVGIGLSQLFGAWQH